MISKYIPIIGQSFPCKNVATICGLFDGITFIGTASPEGFLPLDGWLRIKPNHVKIY